MKSLINDDILSHFPPIMEIMAKWQQWPNLMSKVLIISKFQCEKMKTTVVECLE